MKEFSIFKIFVCLAITYSFFPMDTLRMYAPSLVIRRLRNLNNWFLKLSQLMERHMIQDPETYMTTPEMIKHRGYPVETHHGITDDGYILELHRIPHGRRETRNETFDPSLIQQRRAVFLQHGMMGTDHFWMVGSTNNSLSFILADLGYDVWMGNSRGNIYSRKHISLNPDEDKEFWEFSWDEMGRYDIPNSIDYVLNVTGQPTLGAYIGYSLGVSIFFIGAIEEPRLNDKVELMIGMEPTVSSAHLKNYFRYMARFEKFYQLYQRWFGIGEVHAKNSLLHTLVRLMGKSSEFGAQMARQWLSRVFGNTDDLTKVEFHRLISHYPAGGSANTMAHLFQNYIVGESFNYYDYGPVGNLKRYRSKYSPEYNLTLVTAPVVLVHADKDPFAPPEDVSWLKGQLGNLVDSIRVNCSTFCHGDFIWSHRISELVYWPVIRLLPAPLSVTKTTDNMICIPININ